jgi:hypothetical protein
MADAKKVIANKNPSPGSSFATPDDIDMDMGIALGPEVEATGYKYIKSIAKFIDAWIAS